jgi:hypothetical protein
LNLDIYSRNDPIDFNDPNGEFWHFFAILLKVIIHAFGHIGAALGHATTAQVSATVGGTQVGTGVTIYADAIAAGRVARAQVLSKDFGCPGVPKFGTRVLGKAFCFYSAVPCEAGRPWRGGPL